MKTYSAAALLVLLATLASAGAQMSPTSAPEDGARRNFSLADTGDLIVIGGEAARVEYQGRKAVRLTAEKGEAFALLKGIQFQDGAIEADLAVKTTTPQGVRNPGFLGIAFRAASDASRYDMIYVRPGNSISADQAMRNHSVQYVAAPGNDWYKLRRQWLGDREPRGRWDEGCRLVGRRGFVEHVGGRSLLFERDSHCGQSGAREQRRRGFGNMEREVFE